MRLGDLDALKEDLKQYFSDGTLDSVSAKIAFSMVLRKIDNAPTVEPFERIGAICNENCGYKPQGEWYYGEDECGQDGWFCSECGFFVPWYYQYYEKDINFIREYKACPHCLAEMVTYTGKDRDTKGGAKNDK